MSGLGDSIDEMKMSNLEVIIERNYRETGPFQWAREGLQNSLEADADQVWFDVEPQAYANGVARMMLVDNGKGMTADQLRTYMNTYGEGGKQIGGLHENYGIGFKTTILPWNKEGVVVISWTSPDSVNMIQLTTKDGKIGLRLWEVEDEAGNSEFCSVVEPLEGVNDDRYNIDWARVRSEFINQWKDDDKLKKSGTIVVFLGNTSKTNTVLGDPKRPEESKHYALRRYINQRYWSLSMVKVHIREFRSGPGSWFKSRLLSDRSESITWTWAIAYGADAYIRYGNEMRRSDASTAGKIKTGGELILPDSTEVCYYLWEGPRPPAVERFFYKRGFIGIYYKNELYDITDHVSHYRQFGIAESSVRENLTLILTPPVAGDQAYGIYPRADRNNLLIINKDGENGHKLPFAEWAKAFCDNMPESIRDAIQASYNNKAEEPEDSEFARRLWARFGSRFPMKPPPPPFEDCLDQPPKEDPKKPRKSKPRKRQEKLSGLPPYILKEAADFDDPATLASWMPRHHEYKCGAVLLNISHPVLKDVVAYWQDRVPDHYAEETAKIVYQVYGLLASCAIAHTEQLASGCNAVWSRPYIEEQLRSDSALTMSLLGLAAEESLITDRLKKFGLRKESAVIPDDKIAYRGKEKTG